MSENLLHPTSPLAFSTTYTATITTVSRYMKHMMWEYGVNPLVIPNGIPKSLLGDIDSAMAQEVRKAAGSEIILCKVARWDPDKRWHQAVQAVHDAFHLA
jgi:hypothetical protein